MHIDGDDDSPRWWVNSNTASRRRIEWNWLSVCWFPLPLKEKGYSRPSPPGRPTYFDGHEWADESLGKQVRLIGLAIPPKYLPGNFARSLLTHRLWTQALYPAGYHGFVPDPSWTEVMESYARPRVAKIIVFPDFMTFCVNSDGKLASFQRGVGHSAWWALREACESREKMQQRKEGSVTMAQWNKWNDANK